MINYNQAVLCPVCQTKITFDAKQLLAGRQFNCPNSGCKAVIGLNKKSKPVVTPTLEKLNSV